MPTNLPPQATAAWERYLDANTTVDKITSLEEYLSLIPKHKGAEKLVRQTKIKLSKLREELRQEKAKRKGTGEKWHVSKEGNAQIAIIGTPSSGKTAFLNSLSGSAYDEGVFQFTTTKPQVGVLNAQGAQLQLVDYPGIIEGSNQGFANGTRVLGGIRNADLVIIILDLSNNPIEQFEIIVNELNRSQIRLNVDIPKVTVEKTGKGGKQIFQGNHFIYGKEGVLEYLSEKKIVNAIVKFSGPTTLEELNDALSSSVIHQRGIIFATKGDLPGSKLNFSKLKDYLDSKNIKFKIIPYSAKIVKTTSRDISEILFKSLGIIRVYTKNEAGFVAEKPVVVSQGTTVKDIVEMISKNMLKYFRFARIWGSSIKFDGERVGLEHQIEDLDQIQVFA